MTQKWKETIMTAIAGGFFILWLGFAGGVDTGKLTMIEFLQATVFIVVLGVCVWTLMFFDQKRGRRIKHDRKTRSK